MDDKIKWLIAQYQGLDKKSQLIALAVCLLLVTLLWYAIAWSPLMTSRSVIDRDVAAINTQAKTFDDEMAVVSATLANDPDAVIKEKQAILQADLKTLSEQLAIYDSELVSAPQMLSKLRTLVSDEHDLVLLSLDSVSGGPLLTEQQGHHLIRQGVKIELEGNFYAILTYLRAIEGLKWRLFWDKIDYKVTQYPKAHVTLQLYSIGEKG